MRAMNVSLPPELEELIRQQIASGLYGSPGEVIEAALRLLAEEQEWKADVRSKIDAGMTEARAGQLEDGEAATREVLDGLQDRPWPRTS